LIPVVNQYEHEKLLHQFWRAVHIKKLIPYFIFSLMLLIALVILGKDIKHHLVAIEGWISSMGLSGILAYIILFILLTSVFFPDTLMGILAGTLFGLRLRSIAVFAGYLLGSALQYWLSRNLIKKRFERLIASRQNLISIQRAVRRQELRLQFLLRMTPISPVMLSYMLGASGVKFVGFLIACIAHFPMFFLEVYFGYAGRHIARIAGRSEIALMAHDIIIFWGFISAVVVVVFVSRMARHAIETATLS
jgi:uncharacterized membrane protein YdjX (TVP38/TMEM64 family)